MIIFISLEKTYPRDFADMLTWAKKYTSAEEAFKLCNVGTADEQKQREYSRLPD